MQVLDGQQRPLGVDTIFHKEPVSFSNQVPTNLNPTANKRGLIYGDWSELLIGVWSEIDILINPYESAAYARGNISMRAIATADTACRHPEAFVSATAFAVGMTGAATLSIAIERRAFPRNSGAGRPAAVGRLCRNLWQRSAPWRHRGNDRAGCV
ncbi:MAG: phage major capsid protein [Sphingomonadales bacterium]|nr:phage major capsid protein [Sphingomonadales bacterium]